MKVPTGFVGYASQPLSVADAISAAVNDINLGQEIILKTWEQCSVTGKLIINELCEEIDNADLFCADLTGSNPNVMFELGYAIASNKRVWLLFDTSYSQSRRDFEQLRTLTTIGYAPYVNSRDIINKFYSDAPHKSLDKTIYEQIIDPSTHVVSNDKLLYLKSRYDTEPGIKLGARIKKSKFRSIIDDPLETGTQSLSWYVSQLYQSAAVVCHFDNVGREGAALYNARHALICGMACGFKKPILMLAESEYLAPLDYRDMLQYYKRAVDAARFLDEWLIPLEAKKVDSKGHSARVTPLASSLRELQIGEYVAENEGDQLVDDYFIETAVYLEALSGRNRIFVGRKGSGKTANMLKLAASFREDHKSFICLIQPAAYDLKGIVSLVTKYKEADQAGFVIESLWKFLILTEIANTVAQSIEARPSHLERNSDELALLEILGAPGGSLREDFPIRLERYVQSLLATMHSDSIEATRVAISEALHRGILSKLRDLLSKLISDKQRIVLLIDNLDKAWDRQSDLGTLAEVLLGLLTAIKGISDDFQRQDSRRKSIAVTMAVFLRADIFYKVMEKAREPDKILYSRLIWSDPDMLLQIIEQRFASQAGGKASVSELWSKYFTSTVKGLPIKEYVISRILPRPRDIVYLIKAAVASAINRKHLIVEESDILAAEKLYSQYVRDSILAEDSLIGAQLEDVFYEFVGSNAVINETELADVFNKIGLKISESIIDSLCKLSFLGAEVSVDKFRFSDDPEELRKIEVLARKLYAKRKQPRRFRIHNAFHNFLEIETV